MTRRSAVQVSGYADVRDAAEKLGVTTSALRNHIRNYGDLSRLERYAAAVMIRAASRCRPACNDQERAWCGIDCGAVGLWTELFLPPPGHRLAHPERRGSAGRYRCGARRLSYFRRAGRIGHSRKPGRSRGCLYRYHADGPSRNRAIGGLRPSYCIPGRGSEHRDRCPR